MDGSVVFIRLCQCALPSNTCFLWLTRVHFPNGISIGSAVSAGLTIVTDRPTDRPYSVCNNRLHLRSTAMRPNSGQSNLTKGRQKAAMRQKVASPQHIDCSPYTLQWAVPPHPQNCLLPWGYLDSHLIHSSWSQPEATPANDISIVSAVFAELTIVTDRQTDRQTMLFRL